jgi:hypothetical protein
MRFESSIKAVSSHCPFSSFPGTRYHCCSPSSLPYSLTVCYGNDMEMKRKTNFDITLEEQFKNKDLTDRFKKAGRTWDVAL